MADGIIEDIIFIGYFSLQKTESATDFVSGLKIRSIDESKLF